MRFSTPIIVWLFCLAGLVFPFSVAATNVALGMALGMGILSGLWWQGVAKMWLHYRWLCISMLLYWGTMMLGLAWSHDRVWGFHVFGRQWFWLLVPVMLVGLALERDRQRFMIALSLGLGFNLIFCMLQMFGYITVTNVAGSISTDATGHIGHIGFGAIYGMWAGWLMHWGWCRDGWKRVFAWGMAGWAWVMIFLAQGRSGYVVAIVLFSVVLWKVFLNKNDWRRFGWGVFFLLLIVGVLALGPAKDRLQQTWHDIQAIQHGNLSNSGPRWSLWRGALYIWQEHPLLGVGTGGFPKASTEVAKLHSELDYGAPQHGWREHVRGIFAVHPHNMYLLALARWGVLGVLALGVLFFFWIRTGWQQNWRGMGGDGVLIALSGIALAVHGLTSPSLEEHFESIFAVLILGAGLAGLPESRSEAC